MLWKRRQAVVHLLFTSVLCSCSWVFHVNSLAQGSPAPQVSASPPHQSAQTGALPQVATSTSLSQDGFPARYYYYSNNPPNAGLFVKEVIDRKIDFLWAGINPDGFDTEKKTGIYVEWNGDLALKQEGVYAFRVLVQNGGFRFYVDGVLIHDFWTGHSRCCGSIREVDFQERLAAGPHHLLIKYWGSARAVNSQWPTVIQVLWQKPGSNAFLVIQPEDVTPGGHPMDSLIGRYDALLNQNLTLIPRERRRPFEDFRSALMDYKTTH